MLRNLPFPRFPKRDLQKKIKETLETFPYKKNEKKKFFKKFRSKCFETYPFIPRFLKQKIPKDLQKKERKKRFLVKKMKKIFSKSFEAFETYPFISPFFKERPTKKKYRKR